VIGGFSSRGFAPFGLLEHACTLGTPSFISPFFWNSHSARIPFRGLTIAPSGDPFLSAQSTHVPHSFLTSRSPRLRIVPPPLLPAHGPEILPSSYASFSQALPPVSHQKGRLSAPFNPFLRTNPSFIRPESNFFRGASALQERDIYASTRAPCSDELFSWDAPN